MDPGLTSNYHLRLTAASAGQRKCGRTAQAGVTVSHMLVQVGTWAVTLVGIAAGANLLALGRAKRLSQMRAEAELVNLLSDGAAKDALTRKVAEDVLSHINLDRSARNRRARRLATAGLIAGGILIAAFWVLAMIVITADPPDWVNAATVAVGLLVVAAASFSWVWSRRIDKISDATEDESATEVRVAEMLEALDPAQDRKEPTRASDRRPHASQGSVSRPTPPLQRSPDNEQGQVDVVTGEEARSTEGAAVKASPLQRP
jgi:hypothetical protein